MLIREAGEALERSKREKRGLTLALALSVCFHVGLAGTLGGWMVSDHFEPAGVQVMRISLLSLPAEGPISLGQSPMAASGNPEPEGGRPAAPAVKNQSAATPLPEPRKSGPPEPKPKVKENNHPLPTPEPVIAAKSPEPSKAPPDPAPDPPASSIAKEKGPAAAANPAGANPGASPSSTANDHAAPAGNGTGDGPGQGEGNRHGDGPGDGHGQNGGAPSGVPGGHSGTGPSQNSLLAQYARLISGRINRAKRYPSGSREHGEEGAVKVRFVVSAEGRVSEVRVANSSGFPALDEAAVNAVQNAAPFPPFPPELEKSAQTFTVSVQFSLK